MIRKTYHLHLTLTKEQEQYLRKEAKKRKLYMREILMEALEQYIQYGDN